MAPTGELSVEVVEQDVGKQREGRVSLSRMSRDAPMGACPSGSKKLAMSAGRLLR
jgi:hypothetical protein